MSLKDLAPIVSKTELIKFDDVVRIDVGQEGNQKTFVTNPNVLTTRSQFFKKALSGVWQESYDRVVKLPDDHPEVFALYIHYIHAGTLPVTPDTNSSVQEGHEENKALAQLYVLAEKLQDTMTKNTVIKAFLVIILMCREDGVARHKPKAEAIKIIYDGTPAGSMARKLFVDVYVYDIVVGWDPKDPSWPQEFLVEIAAEFLTHHEVYRKCNKTRGKYHHKAYLEEEVK
ncbi:hypothetical protein EKO04_000877 [Ascochyta lentis]|uniref:BTB domain-containing protein n=1 Tax=Ascochyta lentis TaxID=205686 RepID=A0A8H7JEM6_9PLEO|nr:hypothetical protein EKO04_000877 [Ascochyta lentis]